MLFFLPFAALGVGGWSAWRTMQREPRRGQDLVMLLPGPRPSLNPFLPANEAERQLLDLLHEPLIRLDREGRLGAALAEQWSWHQTMTCWFDSPAQAKAAAQAVADQPVEKRISWDLEEVKQEGASLVLSFRHPGSQVAEDVLAVLTTQQPQKLAFLRLFATPSSRALLEDYARDKEHRQTTKRLWFDDDGTCEIVTTRTGLQEQQQLIDYLRPRLPAVPEITPVAEVSALLEPVLDFRLKPNAQWPDGQPIRAADVKATLDYVLPRPWPLAGRAAFRHIQDITAPEPGLVRVIYRKRYSPALPAWTTLPILSASWLKTADDGAFSPPGAGAWHITRQTEDQLWLTRRGGEGPSGLHVMAATSALPTRVGLATGSFDILWPTSLTDGLVKQDRRLALVPTPPHNQLMLIWQTQSPHLRDPQVRTALGQALDRPALSRLMPGGQARLHDSFFPPGRWFSHRPAPLAHDPERALRELNQAGWRKDGEGRLRKAGEELTLRVLIPADNGDRRRLATALAESWKALGIQVQVMESPRDHYLEDLQAGRFEAALLGGELEPGWDVLPLWHSSQAEGRGLNLSRVADAQLDLRLEALMAEFDPEQVPRRAAAVEERLTLLRPAMPLFTDVIEMAVRLEAFPGLADLDSGRGITLRELIPATQPLIRPTIKLEMLAPK